MPQLPCPPLGCEVGFDGVLAGLRAQLANVERLVDELVAEHQREVAPASTCCVLFPQNLRLSAAGGTLNTSLPSLREYQTLTAENGKMEGATATTTPTVFSLDALERSLKDREVLQVEDELEVEMSLAEVDEDEVDDAPCSFDPTEDVNLLLRGSLLEKTLSEEKICSVLQLKADPNASLGPFNCNGKEFKDGTPLAVAVLRGSPGVLRTLVEAGADPDSRYSFEAGAEQLVWSGPASHATVPRGDVEMLKMLIALNADISAKGSNDATPLWQAAYFDQPHILEFLIAHGADLESKAISQDDTSLSYTPLHAAANAGHYRATELLLNARADPKVDNSRGVSPLEDVVQQGHASVAQLLVARGGDLFHVPFGHRRTLNAGYWHSDASHEGMRCIDKVFRSQNPTLVAAVADGLRELPELPPELTKEDLVEFISSPGEAPLIILDTIFRQSQIVFWDARRKRKKRRTKMLAGFISATTRMNVTQGPCREAINTLFNDKQAAPDVFMDFVDRLAPQIAPKKSSMFAPLNIYMCPIRHVHRDLNVPRALAYCARDDVFEKRGCQAIVNLKWQNEWRNARLCRFLMFLEVLNLQFISFFLNSTNHTPELELALLGASTLAIGLWSIMAVLEVATALGYLSCGMGRRYLWRPGSVFSMLAILMTICTIIEIFILRFDASGDPRFCITLGTVIFFKWLRFLFSTSQVKSMGMRILPITSTMLEALPFCLVLLVCLLASTSFYFALGILNFTECFVVLYRLYALGDVDLFEMENTWAPMLSLPTAAGSQLSLDGVIHQEAPPATPYFWVVRAMMIILSFLVGVSMMNLFVAILCRSYVKAAENAMTSFMRNRACVVLDMHAVRLGLSVLLCRKRSDGEECAVGSGSGDLGQVSACEDTAYVWYVVHKAPRQVRSLMAAE